MNIMKRLKIKIALILIVLLGIGNFQIHAQISQGGNAVSFLEKWEIPNPLIIMPSEQLINSSEVEKNCNALEFGHFLPVNISLGAKEWQINETSDGNLVYRLHIQSPNAKAVGAYFSDFNIPSGAKLFIYSPDQKQQIGAYTSFNNPSTGLFATEYITGASLIIEYIEPKEVVGEGRFTLNQILHAYTGIPNFNNERGYGDSGECEVNVNCPEGDFKKKQRDAVVRLLIKSGENAFWCTGSLINNTAEDKTPYVITADHCGKDASIEDQDQWIIFFNYQAEDCENPGIEPEHFSATGCREVASSSNAGMLGSDFYLILLNSNIPESWQPYFLGWNRDGVGSNKGYSIHHPQGDIKKISIYDSNLIESTYTGGMDLGFWRVTWTETLSGHGVTEGGSSGSPIFDDEGYIIGTLTGGQASCSAVNAPDFYGRLDMHWDQNGFNDDQRLKPWLDPLNTGVEKMNGVYLSIDDEELAQNHLFSALPNPVENNLVLSFDRNYSEFQITISDIQGREVYNAHQKGNFSLDISLNTFNSGLYFVKVNSKDNTQVIKIIKL